MNQTQFKTTSRRYPRKPIRRRTTPQTVTVGSDMARESVLNFAKSINPKFEENTVINYLVDECSANVTLVGKGFIVSFIYQEIKL